MEPNPKIIKDLDLQGWPAHWPPPCKFLGPLIFSITSIHFCSSLTEHQAIIRFQNQYGVRIAENFFHGGLYLVAILRFYGPHPDDYSLVHDTPLPEFTWYFDSHEVFALTEEVARWK